MKPSIYIGEIVEFDADSLWEAVCRHFQASDMQIVDVELREKPLDDLYQVVLTYPDGEFGVVGCQIPSFTPFMISTLVELHLWRKWGVL